ncbi:hypothetical protein GCM10023212_12810 [Luteolibacter yonseiensis]
MGIFTEDGGDVYLLQLRKRAPGQISVLFEMISQKMTGPAKKICDIAMPFPQRLGHSFNGGNHGLADEIPDVVVTENVINIRWRLLYFGSPVRLELIPCDSRKKGQNRTKP